MLALWEHLSAPYGMTFSLLALGGQFVAVYLSGKYRLLVAAMAIGGLAAVFLRLMVPAPEDWTYMVLVFHLGTALLLFYLLKLVQDHLWAGFAKRMRTMAGALLMLVLGTALTLGRGTEQLVVRYAEADVVVRQLRSRIADGSSLTAAARWSALLLPLHPRHGPKAVRACGQAEGHGHQLRARGPFRRAGPERRAAPS